MAGGGREGELNLVPYLDIVVTLTIALILMTTSVVDLKSTHVAVPGYVPPGPGAATAPLSLDIGADGFTLVSDGTSATLGRDGGAFPYAKLTEILRGLRDGGESTKTLRLSADPAIPYSVVVATLDAARKDDRGDLYPDVAMAVVASR